MKYNKPIVKAKFINRPNRFYSNVILDGKEIRVHVPNTGRCREILIEGCTVFLREENPLNILSDANYKNPIEAFEKGYSFGKEAVL